MLYLKEELLKKSCSLARSSANKLAKFLFGLTMHGKHYFVDAFKAIQNAGIYFVTQVHPLMTQEFSIEGLLSASTIVFLLYICTCLPRFSEWTKWTIRILYIYYIQKCEDRCQDNRF